MSFKIATGEVTIGREPPSDIVLDDDKASRQHVRIEVRDGRCHIIDLGSSNGTFVNGELISERELADGDEIGIGKHILRFDAEDRKRAEMPTKIGGPAPLGVEVAEADTPGACIESVVAEIREAAALIETGLRDKDRKPVSQACLRLLQAERALREVRENVFWRADLADAKYESADVNALVSSVVESFARPAPHVRFETTLDPGVPPIVANRAGVARVVSCLMDKSIRDLAGEKGCIHVETANDPAAEEICVEVKATVAGGLEPVQRASRKTVVGSPVTASLDFGLSVAEQIVKTHGGTFVVESPVQGIMRLVARLPYEAAPARRSEAETVIPQ